MPYGKFKDEEGNPFGSFEVFFHNGYTPKGEEEHPVGWYWWPCFPGCLPDGEMVGPFDTEEKAKEHAEFT